MDPDSFINETTKLYLALRSAMDEALVGSRVTAAQFGVLHALRREPGLSNAELARRLAVTPQTTHTIVTGLVSAGLVVRQPHPVYVRLLALYLSNAGESVVEEAEPMVADVERRIVALLTDEEQTSFLRLLRMCASSLG